MKNGRADHDDDPERDPKIARIEDARRRRQLGLAETGKDTKSARGARMALPKGGNFKELVVGAVIVAMAVGFLVHLARPLWQGALSFAP